MEDLVIGLKNELRQEMLGAKEEPERAELGHHLLGDALKARVFADREPAYFNIDEQFASSVTEALQLKKHVREDLGRLDLGAERIELLGRALDQPGRMDALLAFLGRSALQDQRVLRVLDLRDVGMTASEAKCLALKLCDETVSQRRR